MRQTSLGLKFNNVEGEEDDFEQKTKRLLMDENYDRPNTHLTNLIQKEKSVRTKKVFTISKSAVN